MDQGSDSLRRTGRIRKVSYGIFLTGIIGGLLSAFLREDPVGGKDGNLKPLYSKVGNIVLIGMPGSGKSTVGVLLAKATQRNFLDTDVVIQAEEGRGLQEIIDEEGLDFFRRMEERHILSLDCRDCVIATGGSVVYYPPAMVHLAASGVIVYLDLDLSSLIRRLTNLPSRGVVRVPCQTLNDLFEQRKPLYKKYAQITVSCAGRTHEEIVNAIIAELETL